MPQAGIIDVADAIVTELNGHSFSQPFTSARGYLPTFDLQEMGELKVTVVPKEDDGKLDTRTASTHDYAIDIGVQKKPPAIDNTDLDRSLDFVVIDAEHGYESVVADISAWLPKLKQGGVLFGHDYGHPRFPGVKRAFDKLLPGQVTLAPDYLAFQRKEPA